MDATEIESFKSRVGLKAMAPDTNPDGVRASWQDLPSAVAAQMKDLRLTSSQIYPLEPGIAEIAFTWKGRSGALDASIFVSGVGSTKARDRLVSLASQTMMRTIPYQPGPSGLGEIAVWHSVDRSTAIIWAFRNVCVQVTNGATEFPVEAVARSIQRFLESKLVPHVPLYLPRVEGVDLSPPVIHVGDEVRLSVRLAKGSSPEAVETRIKQGNERLLSGGNIKPLTATYRAEHVGRSHIDVTVVDRKTLLSPALSVSFEVLP